MPQASERQLPAVEIRSWPGLMTNVNPHAMPPGGAQEQVNLQMIVGGVLETRPGTRPVTWEV